MKLYRVNSSEIFNLDSMRTKLMNLADEAWEIGNVEDAEAYEARIDEIESLMDKAYCVGALVDWATLKRIREIKAERCMIRYSVCLASGMSESEASLAFSD